MYLYYIALSCVIVYYLLMRWRYRKTYKLASQLKNDLLYLPLVGHALALLGNSKNKMKVFKRFAQISYKTGGLMTFWLGNRLFVHMADPKSLEVVMKTSLEKDDIMFIEHDLFGNGSIFAKVPIWRPRRKVIAPTFSTKNLNQFVRVFSEQGSVMVDQLKLVAGKGNFPLWKFLTTYTMDSICDVTQADMITETALGVKVGAQRNPNHPFLEAFNLHCKKSAKRICMPPIAQKIYKCMIYNSYMKDIYCMWEFVDKIIKDKREEIKENLNKNNIVKHGDKDKTFLEMYIESSGGTAGFTNKELREETLVLLLAGTDTSAVGSAFTSLMLARHPDVQDKVYAEIQEVFGDSDRPLTHEDLPRLKYLEAVIKETLRMYPPVPLILRKIEKDTMLPNGIELPKGTSILVSIWAVHHNPEYWGTDTEEFRPDRFIGQELTHPAAFIPFSYGPRACVGYKYAMMSMQTAVAALVRDYRLSCDTEKPLHLQFDVMMKEASNFEIQLEARH